ncbi:MAG: RNA methyltransferase [Verrucomicrobiales bacterium]|nr:RNA methyltransferase [Verrucomicrobiales bacterium]
MVRFIFAAKMTVDEELVAFLSQYVTENKKSKMAGALQQRTRHIAVVLEEIYQPHNASACLRNCDCLGVQDLYIVENRNSYQPNNGVSMGSAKWLSLHRYRETASAVATLRNQGYRIVATTPNYEGYDPVSLPLDQPVALLFGTEERGLTEKAIQSADDYLCLPMYGFTQSYNISVTVAITLYRLVERLRDSEIHWQLEEADKTKILLEWYRRIVRRHDLLEEEFWKEKENT